MSDVSPVDEQQGADRAAREYEETKRRVIAGAASVQEAQGFIDFLEGAVPSVPSPSPVDEQARERVATAVEPWLFAQKPHKRAAALEAADAALAAARRAEVEQPHEAWPIIEREPEHEPSVPPDLAAARPVPEGVTHALVAGAEDAGHESATVCGSLPLDEPSADLARVDCLSCLRFLAAAAVSPVPRDAGDERQPDAMVTVGLSRIGPHGPATVRVADGERIGRRVPNIADDRQLAAVNAAYEAMCEETELPDDFDAAQSMAMAAVNAFVAAVPSVAQAPTPEDERAYGQLLDLERRVLDLTEDLAERANTLGLTEGQYAAVMTRAERAARRALGSALGSRASTGTEDALRKALRPFEGCWSWGVDVQLADVGALENAARAVLAAARPVTGTGERPA